MTAQPPLVPPPAAGSSIGPPGGVFGPPGGAAPPPPAFFGAAMQPWAGSGVPPPLGAPPLAPLGAPPLAPLGAPPLAPLTSPLPPLVTPPLGGAPGGGLPGAGTPLVLPDLHGVARRAIESVVERAPQPAERAPAAPPPPQSLPIGSQTPHVANVRVGWEALPPPPPPGGAHPEYAPGVWARPARRRVHAPPPRENAWVREDERDLAQRVGDRLYPLVERLRDSRAGWVGVALLFGLTVPIILLRQRFDVRLRLVLAAVTFFFWIGLIQDLV